MHKERKENRYTTSKVKMKGCQDEKDIMKKGQEE